MCHEADDGEDDESGEDARSTVEDGNDEGVPEGKKLSFPHTQRMLLLDCVEVCKTCSSCC